MPTPLSSRLLVRLLATVGALDLAACSSDDSQPSPTGDTQTAGTSSGTSGQGGSSGAPVAGSGGAGSGGAAVGGAGGATAEPWASRPEVPAAASGSYPECGPDQTSPSGFGYHGSCCMDVVCRAPDATTGLCPDPSTVYRGVGSGTCGCGVTEGPFKADAAHQELTVDGQGCCYVAGIIGCDGRPLFIDGRQRAARARAASGWG